VLVGSGVDVSRVKGSEGEQANKKRKTKVKTMKLNFISPSRTICSYSKK
jgi:hypothetical protein